MSVRSGSTACAPDSVSLAAVVPPVATATTRAPVSSAAAPSRGVSPTSTVAGPEKSAPSLHAALARAGIPEPRQHLDQFLARLAALAPEGRELAQRHCRALPGAAAALDALATFAPPGNGAAGNGAAGPAAPVCVVQSVLTGNVRPMAEMKLGALGLDSHLDLDAGAYGESHEIRAELVHLARGNAARRYGADFSGPATVLVGDTPLDVAAALETGARVVAVATGGTTAARLAESGAHAVLPDLTDTPAVLAAILADPDRGRLPG